MAELGYKLGERDRAFQPYTLDAAYAFSAGLGVRRRAARRAGWRFPLLCGREAAAAGPRSTPRASAPGSPSGPHAPLPTRRACVAVHLPRSACV
jgi:hypothetical protein